MSMKRCHLVKHVNNVRLQAHSITHATVYRFRPTSEFCNQSKTLLISVFFERSDSKRAAISGQELRGEKTERGWAGPGLRKHVIRVT